jgi:hypothetical protein
MIPPYAKTRYARCLRCGRGLRTVGYGDVFVDVRPDGEPGSAFCGFGPLHQPDALHRGEEPIALANS